MSFYLKNLSGSINKLEGREYDDKSCEGNQGMESFPELILPRTSQTTKP